MSCSGLPVLLESLEVANVKLLWVGLLAFHSELLLVGLIVHSRVIGFVDLRLIHVLLVLSLLAASRARSDGCHVWLLWLLVFYLAPFAANHAAAIRALLLDSSAARGSSVQV